MVTVVSYCLLDGYRFFLVGHGWLPLFLNNSNTCTVRAPCPVLPLNDLPIPQLTPAYSIPQAAGDSNCGNPLCE